ncbi:uncharacterized protein LOC111710761 [Eurytemora carolleeae]|uniref:uncharacterized protein LOC111710761 n=1 Tax=Eurytemora carolleeae TaxID=1294199 RepID=UPI000C7709BA|nr:uncharacterized protein LOC111710761 [Eurytemora carolleeae]|eukprot:XP_023340656.1 uncharacterized protein LOC111710761 [Eurytemora affinis]
MSLLKLRSNSAEFTSFPAKNLQTQRLQRARSLDRGRNRGLQERTEQRLGGTLPSYRSKRAVLNQDVKPVSQFTSLRRGFTLNGNPILTKEEEEEIISKDEDSAWVWWAIYLFLFCLSIANLITSILVIRLLGVGLGGLEYLEISEAESEVLMWGEADLGSILVKDGEITGYEGEPLHFASKDKQIEVQSFGLNGPKLDISNRSVSLQNIHDFNLLHPSSGELFFSSSDPEWKIPEGLKELRVDELKVGEGGIISPPGNQLRVQAQGQVRISGAEGNVVEGRRVELISRDSILLESTGARGGVELRGGVSLDTVMLPRGGAGFQDEISQYKLCICLPSGKLFKVEMSEFQEVGCAMVDPRKSPCKI